MPRKQNGFGSASSFAFNKVNNKVDRGKGVGAAGSYPSNRSFGSTVARTVIEQYDLDSTWVRWRKGLEFYYQAAWNRIRRLNPAYNPYDETSEEYVDFEINSILYQGTEGEIPVKFDGYRFATRDSDTNNHYVVKRTPVNPQSLGNITAVFNDKLQYPEYFENNEIWVEGSPTSQSFMLRNMIGERITDGETEASLSYILTEKKHPALFIGKSGPSNLTTITVTVPLAELMGSKFIQDNGNDLNALIGELGYIKEIYTQQQIPNSFRFLDGTNFQDVANTLVDGDYFSVDAEFQTNGVSFEILNQNTELPPTLLDISALDTLFESTSANYTITGTYFYDKSLYQRFYGKQYLTADVVASEVDTASFIIFPFTILSTKVVGANVEITSIPFFAECKLYAPIGTKATLVFTDNSFTKTTLDTDIEGNYYHADERDKSGNPLPLWQRINTDINPWEEPVFTSGGDLVPAVIYTCSCPSYSHAQLRMPQATDSDSARKTNRQKRYPLPTAMGVDRFTEGALAQVGGLAQSWATRDYRMSYKQCKHSIAARFIERIKTQEPNTYPSFSSRTRFEEKLQKEINDIPDEFRLSYERSGITTLEIIFAMAEALNMDDTELAYVMLNSSY